MKPTPLSLLVTLALLAGTTGWAVARLFDSVVGRTLEIPVSAPLTMIVLTLSLFVWTVLARPRLLRKKGAKPMPPLLAARTAALAMAASRTGSLVLGLYLGLAIGLWPSWSTQQGRDSVISGVVTAAAAKILVLVALWLERICRIKDGDDQQGGSAAATGRGASPEPAARISDH